MYTGAFAYIDGYGRDVNESRGAAFAAINLPVGLSTMISAALRQDMIAGKYAPLIPSFGIQSWLPGEALQLKANLARSFNYPTMNMRYWVPGGNPDLLPERGVAGDVGVVAAFEWTGGDFRAEATTFLSQVEDWLQWAPTDSGFWAPQNLKSVRSGGVEFSGRANQSLGDFQFSLGARYSFTKSTNVKIEAGGDSTILNKQLMYVPQQVGNVDLVASYKRIRLTLRGTYTGIRYTTQDHLGSVPSYFLMEADADYFFSRERVDFRLGIRLSNLLNSDYQNVEFRPMPGRALMIRLDMNIKTKRY